MASDMDHLDFNSIDSFYLFSFAANFDLSSTRSRRRNGAKLPMVTAWTRVAEQNFQLEVAVFGNQ